MPEDCLGLDDPNMFIEFRGIRGGEKGDRAPIKTLPRVREPTRNPETKKFNVDEQVMVAIARDMGVDNPSKFWASKVDGVPVFATTDTIVGNNGIVYIERAMYTGSGRLCGSPAGEKMAQQRFDPKAYANGKKVVKLPVVREVECSDNCPMWGTPENPTDCRFRAVVTLQLQHRPVFPSPTRHRTTSRNSIRAMVTSLMAIASITGGIVAGIPLFFRQAKIDVTDRTGKTRRIPVMVFDFQGTIQELRQAAIKELASRQALKDAGAGTFSAVVTNAVTPDLDDGFHAVDRVEDDEDDESPVSAPAPEDIKNELASEIALALKSLNYTPAAKKALETKHDGNLESMLLELKKEAGGDFDPSPGAPGDEASEVAEEPESESEPESDGDDDDFPEDLFE